MRTTRNSCLSAASKVLERNITRSICGFGEVHAWRSFRGSRRMICDSLARVTFFVQLSPFQPESSISSRFLKRENFDSASATHLNNCHKSTEPNSCLALCAKQSNQDLSRIVKITTVCIEPARMDNWTKSPRFSKTKTKSVLMKSR